MANNDVKCMVSDRSCSLYIIGKNERNKCGLCSVNSKEKESRSMNDSDTR